MISMEKLKIKSRMIPKHNISTQCKQIMISVHDSLTWKSYTVQLMNHTLPYKKTVYDLAMIFMTTIL